MTLYKRQSMQWKHPSSPAPKKTKLISWDHQNAEVSIQGDQNIFLYILQPFSFYPLYSLYHQIPHRLMFYDHPFGEDLLVNIDVIWNTLSFLVMGVAGQVRACFCPTPSQFSESWPISFYLDTNKWNKILPHFFWKIWSLSTTPAIMCFLTWKNTWLKNQKNFQEISTAKVQAI